MENVFNILRVFDLFATAYIYKLFIYVKFVRADNLFSRCQIEIINYQALNYIDYTYNMTYVNNSIKFCIMSLITSERAKEVAHALLPTFLTFGAPVKLRSDAVKSLLFLLF